MIPKQAIEKAIEGGWKPLKTIVVHDTDAFEQIDYQTIVFYNGTNVELGAPIGRRNLYSIALDPTFWQALGKVLRWAETITNTDVCTECLDNYKPVGWHQNALRFYDLILTGKSTEEFWEEILK